MRILLNVLTAAALITGATLAQAGCMRCDPIYNVTDAVVTSPNGKTLTTEQVKASIMRAGAALGWQVREDRPGVLVATLNLRKHQADIEIPYSATKYSLTYKSSVNLDDSGDGQIHKNYNGWIQNFSKGIIAQLALS
jgi:hypothetical protein